MSTEMKEEKWLKKFEKSKEGKLFALLHDVKKFKSSLQSYDRKSYLSAALMTLAKGTRFEKDATELIELVYPKYFIEP